MTDFLEELLAAYDYFIFDLYGTLIDIRTDEWADATWMTLLSRRIMDV